MFAGLTLEWYGREGHRRLLNFLCSKFSSGYVRAVVDWVGGCDYILFVWWIGEIIFCFSWMVIFIIVSSQFSCFLKLVLAGDLLIICAVTHPWQKTVHCPTDDRHYHDSVLLAYFRSWIYSACLIQKNIRFSQISDRYNAQVIQFSVTSKV